MRLRRVRIAVLCASALLLPLPVSSGALAPSPLRTSTKAGFDAADGAHTNFPREWWRFQSRLRTSDGRDFGFVATYFRFSFGKRRREALSAVYALTDLTASRRIVSERIGRDALGGVRCTPGRLSLAVGSWTAGARASNEFGQRSFDVEMADSSSSVSLTLRTDLRRKFTDVPGLFERSGAARSEFSAYTRLRSQGVVRVGASSFDVSGTSWIDHVYGGANVTIRPAWDLYELELSDGRDVVLQTVRGDGRRNSTAGLVLAADGSSHALRTSTSIGPKGDGPWFWRSRRSLAVYPDIYQLDVPGAGIDMIVSPATPDQEVVSASSGRAYWDGAVDAVDFDSAKKVSGTGFAQLMGY